MDSEWEEIGIFARNITQGSAGGPPNTGRDRILSEGSQSPSLCPGEIAGEVSPVWMTDSGEEMKQVSNPQPLKKKKESWLLGWDRNQIP